MAASDKPRHRSGYDAEEFEQVKSACLTIAVTLGAYLQDICIVGGLVPALLIDAAREAREREDDDRHPGTKDLDVGLALPHPSSAGPVRRRRRGRRPHHQPGRGPRAPLRDAQRAAARLPRRRGRRGLRPRRAPRQNA